MNAPDKEALELDEDQTDLDDDDQAGEPGGSEEDQGQKAEDQEVEIVLQGDDGSQPKRNPLGFTRRIGKLNAKITTAQGEATQASAELVTARESNRLLQLALDQQQAAPATPPDPLDFDDGAKDPKYSAALAEYNRGFFNAEMERHTASQPVVEPATDRALERKQLEHFQAADKINIPDYDKTLDAAIAILGQSAVNVIIGIADADVSVKQLNYLGKNPDKAEEMAALLNGTGLLPARGISALGALGATLVVKPKAKRNPAPDPDDDLEGSSVSQSGKKQERGPPGAKFE